MASQVKTLAALNLDAAGTAQQISATTLEVEVVFITALAANVGDIYIGDANVGATRFLALLDGGQRIEIRPGNVGSGAADFIDLSELYFNGSTTNDDIIVAYIKKAN